MVKDGAPHKFGEFFDTLESMITPQRAINEQKLRGYADGADLYEKIRRGKVAMIQSQLSMLSRRGVLTKEGSGLLSVYQLAEIFRPKSHPKLKEEKRHRLSPDFIALRRKVREVLAVGWMWTEEIFPLVEHYIDDGLAMRRYTRLSISNAKRKHAGRSTMEVYPRDYQVMLGRRDYLRENLTGMMRLMEVERRGERGFMEYRLTENGRKLYDADRKQQKDNLRSSSGEGTLDCQAGGT